MHFWVSEFLCEQTQMVKINNNYSHSLNVITGSMLRPTLFLLYINDVCDLFADLFLSNFMLMILNCIPTVMYHHHVT